MTAYQINSYECVIKKEAWINASDAFGLTHSLTANILQLSFIRLMCTVANHQQAKSMRTHTFHFRCGFFFVLFLKAFHTFRPYLNTYFHIYKLSYSTWTNVCGHLPITPNRFFPKLLPQSLSQIVFACCSIAISVYQSQTQTSSSLATPLSTKQCP